MGEGREPLPGALQVKKQGKARRPKGTKRAPQPGAATARLRPAPMAAGRLVPRGPSGLASALAVRLGMPIASVQVLPAIARRDDRFALALLLAPFLIVAVSLGIERTARQIIARAPQFIAAAQPPSTWQRPPPAPAPKVAAAQRDIIEPPAPALPSLALLMEPPPPALPSLALLMEPPAPALPSLALLMERPAPALPSLALLMEPPAPALPSLALLIEPPAPALPSLALLMPSPPPSMPAERVIASPSPEPAMCLTSPRASVLAQTAPPSDSTAFGLALAVAARAQLRDLVIYNPKYLRISYPMGDVPSLFGVCTDVIVRAYRSLGIDLQSMIQETGSGRGDRNIDHRRVEVVRKFFSRHGAALPVSDLAEDYLPGDIVTYYRPQNRSSTSHIAIVTDQFAPSGRPMIIHNRGWGPQLEDALFVDKITGHYRFRGLPAATKIEAGLKKRRIAHQ